MSQNARIEELSDSDSDPPEDDVDDFADSDIIRSVQPSGFNQRGQLSSKTAAHAPQPQFQPQPTPPEFLRPQIPSQSQRQQGPGFDTTNEPPPEYKSYQCLYPLYFDANKTRAEGRRVGKESAVPNPLAREIVDAVQLLGLKTVFEPGKMHPKDWSNPGRIRVGLKEGGRGKVKNKHHLYVLVAAHLQKNPTTEQSPLRLRVQGMPMPTGPLPPPSVPKGWKLNTILPMHSPALSGGGVSENILKDMMQEMQGAGGQGNPMAGMLGGIGGDPGGGNGSGSGEAKQGKRKREREGKKK